MVTLQFGTQPFSSSNSINFLFIFRPRGSVFSPIILTELVLLWDWEPHFPVPLLSGPSPTMRARQVELRARPLHGADPPVYTRKCPPNTELILCLSSMAGSLAGLWFLSLYIKWLYTPLRSELILASLSLFPGLSNKWFKNSLSKIFPQV